eukprot:9321791-Lingulodinium_polyedra.AAC.1
MPTPRGQRPLHGEARRAANRPRAPNAACRTAGGSRCICSPTRPSVRYRLQQRSLRQRPRNFTSSYDRNCTA